MAKNRIKIKGQKKILVNLNRSIAGIRMNVIMGLDAAGDLVKRKSEDLTSIDTSKLIRSTFSEPSGTIKNPTQVIGYKAEYGAVVHEMPESTNWQRPGAENKFLEKGVVRNIGAIINLIKRFASRRPL